MLPGTRICYIKGKAHFITGPVGPGDGRRIALLLLSPLSLNCVVNITPRPLYTGEREPVPIVKEAVRAQGRTGRVRKNSLPPELDRRTTQPVASRYTNYDVWVCAFAIR
jgi:hypothetical protein